MLDKKNMLNIQYYNITNKNLIIKTFNINEKFVDLKVQKNIFYRLKKICYGINTKFISFLRKLGINIHNNKTAELNINFVKIFIIFMNHYFNTKDFLSSEVKKTINLYILTKNYRLSRLRKQLPLRGQRTHSNASTIKKLSFPGIKIPEEKLSRKEMKKLGLLRKQKDVRKKK